MQQNRHQNFWLGLHLIPQLGVARISQLLSHFESAEDLWYAKVNDLNHLDLPKSLVEQFIHGRDSIDLQQEMDKVHQHKATLITLQDETYPTLLRSIPDPPPVLYVRGDITADDEKCLAIVGTRKPSKYGWDATHQLAHHISQQNVTIVSGLAQGIDTAAHRGALSGNGRTIAVMATGIDKIYPNENIDLAQQIMNHGALITEMPIGTAPLGKNFPRRNRLMSGLSLGVLVAEAPEKSGALITVTSANEQGRDVFAIPHNIFSKTGRGTNRLIQDGAKLVLRVRDILDELDLTHINTQTRIKTEQIQPESEIEVTILKQLGADPIHVDEIVRLTHLPTQHVTSTLAILELKGLAEVAGPMQYCRAR
jgi:DNA processing protein